MNQFEKKIELLLLIKKYGCDGVTQDEILKQMPFMSQSNTSMLLSLLFKIGYVSKEKIKVADNKQYKCYVKYKLTQKAKSIFG